MLVGLNKEVANDRTDTISVYSNFGCYCDVVFLSRCFMNPMKKNANLFFWILMFIGIVLASFSLIIDHVGVSIKQ